MSGVKLFTQRSKNTYNSTMNGNWIRGEIELDLRVKATIIRDASEPRCSGHILERFLTDSARHVDNSGRSSKINVWSARQNDWCEVYNFSF